jgi:hypothetical protein
MSTRPRTLTPLSSTESRRDEPKRWPGVARAAISLVIIAHFIVVAFNYASNNSLRRSEFADQTLVSLQPYLIPLGWYTEFAPVALATGEPFDQAMMIEYKVDRRDTNWTTWVDSRRADARWRRLVALAGALAEHDDSDALGLIAHSLVTHAMKEGKDVQRIRFAMKLPAVSNQLESVYEATVVKLSESDITLIPQIEPTRSVPAISLAQGVGN